MNLRTKLLCYTAAITLSASAAFAAINGNQLADDYLAQGYSFVEVKVGPTQTKVEAIKNGTKVEVVYDNATGDIVKQEQERAAGDDANRTGKDVKTVRRDFEDGDDDDRGRGRGSDDDDDRSSDDDRGRDDSDDRDRNRGGDDSGRDSDNSGSGRDGSDDNSGSDDRGGDDSGSNDD